MTSGVNAVLTVCSAGLESVLETVLFDIHTTDYSQVWVQLTTEVWFQLSVAAVAAALVACFRCESGSLLLHECFRAEVSLQRARRTADAIPSSSAPHGLPADPPLKNSSRSAHSFLRPATLPEVSLSFSFEVLCLPVLPVRVQLLRWALLVLLTGIFL